MEITARHNTQAAFGKKLQDVFKLLVEDIKKLGSKFDFFAEAKAIDKYLSDAGVSNMKSPQFIAEIFDELEYPKSNWKPLKDDLVAFFKMLPDRIRKEKITDDILVKYVPKENWGTFKKDWAKAALSFKNKLGNVPPMITRKCGNKVILSVFLGDIKEQLGISDSELKGYTYNYVYSAVEDAIGKEAISAKLKNRVANIDIKILDCPNASCLHDARYEFVVDTKGKLDNIAILGVKSNVILALKDLGVM